ncbi:MAG: hypothetical protein M1536_05415 [Firmicutes bacterium]|nr:hypothetical protein [Bacillota bacterium]
METVKGTIRNLPLEGNIWVLESDDGISYQLQDAPPGILVEGKKVTLRGEILRDVMGIGMAGPMFKVNG